VITERPVATVSLGHRVQRRFVASEQAKQAHAEHLLGHRRLEFWLLRQSLG
jgi:hypothetical protein